MKLQCKTSLVLSTLTAVFIALTAAFFLDLWGKTPELPSAPLVDPAFTSPATVRISASELIRTGGDLSDFDCYACHERDKPPQLKFDDDHKIILEGHDYIDFAHGRHNRNNNCYNCHDEHNLELLQTRDGSEVKIADSALLCGSCHGPTYRDWEAGVHGRSSGFWDVALGEKQRKTCVACHDPHHPSFPSWAPAPPPIPIRPIEKQISGKDH